MYVLDSKVTSLLKTSGAKGVLFIESIPGKISLLLDTFSPKEKTFVRKWCYDFPMLSAIHTEAWKTFVSHFKKTEELICCFFLLSKLHIFLEIALAIKKSHTWCIQSIYGSTGSLRSSLSLFSKRAKTGAKWTQN